MESESLEGEPLAELLRPVRETHREPVGAEARLAAPPTNGKTPPPGLDSPPPGLDSAAKAPAETA